MKRILLAGMILINSAILSASSLDDAAFSLYRGEVSEEVLKNNFSKIDYEVIMEKFKKMKLEKAKKEAEQQRVNALLKKRNEELQEEVQKNSRKKDKPSITETVNRVYRGLYGDNPDRVNKLKDLGFNSKEIQEIQRRVNKLVESEKNKK